MNFKSDYYYTSSKNIIIISDLHVGSVVGLCPQKVKLESGGYYIPNEVQLKILNTWKKFWKKIENLLDGESTLVINGDLIDGVHHGTKSIWSQNFFDQISVASKLIEDSIIKSEKLNKLIKEIFILKGTEAHAGKNCEFEEILTTILVEKFKKYDKKVGLQANYELFLVFGKNKNLCHFSHHMSSSISSKFGEVTSLIKEIDLLVDNLVRWEKTKKIPKFIIRSHCHSCCKVEIPVGGRYERDENTIVGISTPCWQGKTPYSYRIPSGRNRRVQLGGVLLQEEEKSESFYSVNSKLFVDCI